MMAIDFVVCYVSEIILQSIVQIQKHRCGGINPLAVINKFVINIERISNGKFWDQHQPCYIRTYGFMIRIFFLKKS